MNIVDTYYKYMKKQRDQALLNSLYKMCIHNQTVFLYIEKLTDDLQLSKALISCTKQYDSNIQNIKQALSLFGKRPVYIHRTSLVAQKLFTRLFVNINTTTPKLCHIAIKRCYDNIVLLLKIVGKHTAINKAHLQITHDMLSSIEKNIQNLTKILRDRNKDITQCSKPNE